jgi:2-iminobutanoate/2-iminopropanoate deaminase
METIFTAKAPKAAGPYSQAQLTRAREVLFLSGQIAFDPESGAMIQTDMEAETERVLKNVAAVLEAAGMGRTDVVKTTIFLVDLKDFEAMNRAYETFFGEHKPARSAIEVAGLPKGARIEIEAVAVRE